MGKQDEPKTVTTALDINFEPNNLVFDDPIYLGDQVSEWSNQKVDLSKSYRDAISKLNDLISKLDEEA